MQNGTGVITDRERRKKNLHIVAASFLILNGVPALIAGASLMMDPSGSGLGLDKSLLETSPFENFLVPGIVLFLVNGVFSLISLYALIKQYKLYSLLIIIQGIILAGWITFQIMLISDPSWLQLMYGFVGTILIVTGLKLENLNNERGAYQKI